MTNQTCPCRSFLGLSFDLADATHISAPDYMTLVKRLSSYDTGRRRAWGEGGAGRE